MTASMRNSTRPDSTNGFTGPAATLDNVTINVGENLVLDQMSLTLEKGLIHGILGRGGSGRTTLLKVIATLLKPDSGTVTVLGTDPSTCSSAELVELRRLVGFQFQNLGLFDSMCALDNVLFSLTGGSPESASQADIERAFEMLRLVGLESAAEKSVAQLSGGMQRRLAIARAFAPSHTEIVLFDDPTGGLDPVNASRILQLVTGRASSKTVVLTSHETQSLMDTCDMIHVISNGHMAFSGTPDMALQSTDAAVTALVRTDTVR
jgi:ABC-type transporter Mla maintaining outer membrane lipid asymmetry ATPase subunit MlaF